MPAPLLHHNWGLLKRRESEREREVCVTKAYTFPDVSKPVRLETQTPNPIFPEATLSQKCEKADEVSVLVRSQILGRLPVAPMAIARAALDSITAQPATVFPTLFSHQLKRDRLLLSEAAVGW